MDKNKLKIREDISKRPIQINQTLIEQLLKEDNPGELLSLYLFYSYLAVWKSAYLKRACLKLLNRKLKWGLGRLRKARRRLIELGLIEDRIERDDDGTILGHSIVVYQNINKELYQPYNFDSTEKKRKVAKRKEKMILKEKENYIKEKEKNSTTFKNEFQFALNFEKTIYKKCAETFYNALQKKRKIYRRVSVHLWEKEFQKLIQEAGKEKVLTVLKWYIKHIGEKYIPSAYSARTFREKFPQIEDAKNRHLPSLKCSKEAKWIYKQLKKEYAEIPRNILPYIQQSLQNFQQYESLHKAFVERTQDTDLKGFGIKFYQNLPTEEEFILEWWRSICNIIGRDWKKLSTRHIFHFQNEYFQDRGRKESVEWSGDDELWNAYIGCLYAD